MWRLSEQLIRRRRHPFDQQQPLLTLAAAVVATVAGGTLVWHHQQLQQQERRDDHVEETTTPTAATTTTAATRSSEPPAHDNYNQFSKNRMSSLVQSAAAAVTAPNSTAWTTPSTAQCEPLGFRITRLRRHQTIQKMEKTAEKDTIDSRYRVDWKFPLGEGTFGKVYEGVDRRTGERVAVKKISKAITDNVAFTREMDALLHLRQHNGHPNICGLRENFDENNYYYLVLDLVTGGEMFDALCANGAYSELDAARLVREVANALHFMHGIGIVHGDLKPENLMLSSKNSSAAVIQVVDFGCAQTTLVDDLEGRLDPVERQSQGGSAATPAYSPPEIIEQRRRAKKNPKERKPVDPSFDCWALGVILFIMLTGVHPFDLYGNATDEEIEANILAKKLPPLRRSPLTAHLSKDAIAVIEGLLQWNSKKRLSAHQLLNNKWVLGETARTMKIADSDKRLSTYRAFRSKLEAKVFSDLVAMSDAMEKKGGEVTKRTSLIEQAFQKFDPSHRGYVTTRDLQKLSGHKDSDDVDEELSLSGFSDLLAEHMKNRYFPKGHIIYHEGDRGENMYFLDSGTVEVYSKDFKETVHSGDFFGEGALLHPKKIRSANVRCLTPIHAIEVSREYFEKYMAADNDAVLNLREKDKSRKRSRAKMILKVQQQMGAMFVECGEHIFKEGDDGKQCYILEEGSVDISVKNHRVFRVQEGEMFGERGVILGLRQNTAAECTSPGGCKLQVLRDYDFYKLLDLHPTLKESVRDTCYRREFQKAICMMTKKPFPKNERDLKAAFNAVDINRSGVLELRNVRNAIMRLDSSFKESDVRDILKSLDLDDSGEVSWPEFKRIFGYGTGEDDH